MFLKRILPVFFILISVSGCQSSTKNSIKEDTVKNDNSARLIKIIESINSNKPDSFRATISLNSIVNKVAYNVSGNAYFVNKPRKIKLKLADLIFRSPMIELLQLDNTLKVYTPTDETLYIRNVKQMQNNNLLEDNLNFITLIGMGKVPLLNNYRIKSVISKEANEELLLLENDNHFQTIAFKNSIPSKVLIINKLNKDKLEIYFSKPFKVDNFQFYSRIKAYSKKSKNRFTINYSNIKTKLKFDHKRIFQLKVPRNTKIK